jgi:hypothetical protein
MSHSSATSSVRIEGANRGVDGKRVSGSRDPPLVMRMSAVVEVQGLAAVVATALATVGALPQLRRLLTSRDVAGLSISSAALGLGTELAWVGYTCTKSCGWPCRRL